MIRHYRKTKTIAAGMLFLMIMVLLFQSDLLCSLADRFPRRTPPNLDELKINTYSNLLTRSSSKDLIVIMTPTPSLKLASRLKLLDSNLSDNFTTPLLIMYNSAADRADLVSLTNVVQRQMMFLDISPVFMVYPSDFDTCRTKTTYWRRGKWNYQQMIRFWFKLLFTLPQFQQYEYIMRLDDDSKVLGRWINVFQEMRDKKAVYFGNDYDTDLESSLPGTMKLPYITMRYLIVNNITVKQPDMIREGFGENSLRTYFNNFEVVKGEFFRRDDVQQWVEEIDRSNGIFKYRWGDAPLRFLTLAVFAQSHEVLHRADYNLSYCHKC